MQRLRRERNCGGILSPYGPQELNVPTEPSDMSFAVSLKNRTFEWSSDGLAGLFATRTNMASPAFATMIADMLRFNKCEGGGGLASSAHTGIKL